LAGSSMDMAVIGTVPRFTAHMGNPSNDGKVKGFFFEEPVP
jgi:hypothetical protein